MNNQKGFTLIELMIVVAIIGILAAIAIPQYSRYQAKAKVSAAMAEASALKTGVEDTINAGTVPTLALAGGTSPTSNCSTLAVNGSLTANTTVVCTIQNAPQQVNAKTVTFTRDTTGTWSCASNVTDTTLLPKSCGGS
ncbi:pilin [Pseudomonas sp. RIT-PI-S]|uniref:pilin n=1 Tax=Pseudomonas sp. RIT-PI-S TaxID=3035295 RepID=UPI0021DB51C9|nr:pilin [Pseudomonas sp. RIT-PI-S]